MELRLNKSQDKLIALLTKIKISYLSALDYVDLTKYDEYTITRKLIEMIESSNGKKLEIKKTFTLLKGGSDAE